MTNDMTESEEFATKYRDCTLEGFNAILQQGLRWQIRSFFTLDILLHALNRAKEVQFVSVNSWKDGTAEIVEVSWFATRLLRGTYKEMLLTWIDAHENFRCTDASWTHSAVDMVDDSADSQYLLTGITE